MSAKAKAKPHYVNNKDFSQAVCDYAREAKGLIDNGDPAPIIPNYIAACLLRIAEGLSHKSNFVRYTYREEMVMDAVENCLKAVMNYDFDAATRKGTPNAFGYFTQISWYAFLRRIQKEKKQQDVKLRFIAESGLEQFMIDPNEDPEAARAVESFVEKLKGRIDEVKDRDNKFETYKQKQKLGNRGKSLDSDLTEMFEE